MDAVITAGGITLPTDPLYAVTGLEKKALTLLSGKPMVRWVVDALWNSGLIERIAVVGLEPEEISFGDAPVYFADSAGGLIDNVLTGLETIRKVNPSVKKIMLCSSDIPLITPDIVRGFVEECGDQEADAYYAVVEKNVMEARFPGSRRTFVPFKDGRYSGGDAFLFDVAATKGDVKIFRSLTSSRKNYLEQVRVFGYRYVVKFLLRRMTVHEAAREGSKRFNLNARVITTRFAELGMDLDKPHQYKMIKAELEKRQSQLVTSPPPSP